jgi:P2-related tail formation protein
MNNLPLAVSGNPTYNAFINWFEQQTQVNVVNLMPTLIDICPSAYLPYLAQNFGIYSEPIWQLCETDEQKRNAIKASVSYHQLKGTPQSIRNMLAIFNQGDALIEENFNKIARNGVITRNGLNSHGVTEGSWAQWRITLNNPITIDRAQILFTALKLTAPARCQLVGINYQQAENRHNGAILRNGNNTRGAVAQILTGA